MKGYERFYYAFSSILVFIFGLQLLGESTQNVADVIEPVVETLITGDISALGAGWLLAYILLNGATAAAIGIAFLESGLIDIIQTYMVISGARLGAAFIVIFIGVLEYVKGKNPDIRDSCSVGILQFLTTYVVYIPAILVGYLALKFWELSFLAVSAPSQVNYGLDLLFGPFTSFISNYFGPGSLFVIAILLLLWSLQVFDKAFKGISVDKFRSDYLRFKLSNKWVSFGFGSIITLLTTSVALSVGIIVPLYNRGYFKRKEIIPYLMGANLTTMISSIMAATVIDSALGMQATLVLTLSLIIVTLVTLLLYDKVYSLIKLAFDRIMLENRYLYIFTGILVLTPLLMILLF